MDTTSSTKILIEELAHSENQEIMEGVLEDFLESGTAFRCSDQEFTKQWHRAAAKLLACIVPGPHGQDMLIEGGPYRGCWLESTGTISTETLSRFCRRSAESTLALYPIFQREDGLLPYKVTDDGPAFRQIQLVSPPARSVWIHSRLHETDESLLQDLYRSLEKYDGWLSTHRNTRGTGGLEAFCAYDTGHDLSPRFWHIPDTTFLEDPTRFDPDCPTLPLVAPDLTASLSCGRSYLERIAEDLGKTSKEIRWWRELAQESAQALEKYCWHQEDEFYYDLDALDRPVRIQSDVLLRVAACEIGDYERFRGSLERYLLNTRKFFARYPFTSIAMDDPRFDPHSDYNSWAGPTNFLTLIRTPQAFEHHGRFTELTAILMPSVEALSRAQGFGQTLNPWNGDEGYTEDYSPAMLSLLDFVERLCGILPRPDATLWFSSLPPKKLGGKPTESMDFEYQRLIDGRNFKLAVSERSQRSERFAQLSIDGTAILRFPGGCRLVTDRRGEPLRLIGMSPRTIQGILEWRGATKDVALDGNEVLDLEGFPELGKPRRMTSSPVVSPIY